MTRTIIVDRIQLPSSTVPGEKPPNTLKHGELWVNTADGLTYAGVDGSAPVIVGDKGGGGASNLGDLLNVNTATSAVSGTNQVGFLVRDGSVGTETDPGAYKVTTALDAGTY